MIRKDLIAPISELLDRRATEYAAKPAFTDKDSSITYEELNQQTYNLATQLKNMGLAPGESVGIWLPNSVDWVIASLAAVRAGGICVPISIDSKPGEVSYRINDAQCKILVLGRDHEDMLAGLDLLVRDELKAIYVDQTDMIREGGFADLCAVPADGINLEADDIDATSYIVYTSGTTGQPKGVKLTSRGMLWVNAACWSPIYGMGPEDRVLSPLPLFHSYALNISVLAILANGASEYIMDRFSTSAAMKLLTEGDYTLMPGVPTMFHYLMEAAREQDKNPFKTVRRCVSAGAIMPATLNGEFEEHFGIELLDGYGITETSTMVTMNWPGDSRMPGSCGLPVPGLSVRIIDPASGEDMEIGEEGELICRGPNLMLGYHNKPDETLKALRKGWYHTGDLARCDPNGFLTITGRLKEIIIRGGQNIAPAEVEEEILKLDQVLDCAIVGVSHETLGEVPHAFIVTREGQTIEPKDIIAHCSVTLSRYKIPEQFVEIDAIPRTGSGKILRFKLKEQAEAAMN